MSRTRIPAVAVLPVEDPHALAAPPDLKNSRTPKPSIEEAKAALKLLNWGKNYTLDRYEAQKTVGRFITEELGMPQILVSTGFETLGKLDAMMLVAKATVNKAKATVKERTDAVEALALLTRSYTDLMNKMYLWSKDIPNSNPLPAPSLQLRAGPTLNVQINNAPDDTEVEADANTLANDEQKE